MNHKNLVDKIRIHEISFFFSFHVYFDDPIRFTTTSQSHIWKWKWIPLRLFSEVKKKNYLWFKNWIQATYFDEYFSIYSFCCRINMFDNLSGKNVLFDSVFFFIFWKWQNIVCKKIVFIFLRFFFFRVCEMLHIDSVCNRCYITRDILDICHLNIDHLTQYVFNMCHHSRCDYFHKSLSMFPLKIEKKKEEKLRNLVFWML